MHMSSGRFEQMVVLEEVTKKMSSESYKTMNTQTKFQGNLDEILHLFSGQPVKTVIVSFFITDCL